MPSTRSAWARSASGPVGTMSTGQKQRVKLAAALAHDPSLILLDEPTDGLDPVQRDDMLTLIRRVGTEFGINVLLSSHLLDEVERVCDSAVILVDGRVAAAGPLDELRTGVGGWYVEVEAGTDELAAALRRAGADGHARGPAPPRRGHRVGRRRPRRRGRASASASSGWSGAGSRWRTSSSKPGCTDDDARSRRADARIIDRGYRPYDGPRLGAARRRPQPHEAHRPAGHGPAPAAPATRSCRCCRPVIAYVPAIVFVGLAALITDDRVRDNFLPTYGEYYGFIVSALIVFAVVRGARGAVPRPPHRDARPVPRLAAHPRHLRASPRSARSSACWPWPRSGRRC